MTDEDAQFLRDLISAQAGEQQALLAALCGLFRAYATGRPLPETVLEHFERTYAAELAQSLNEPKTQAFEETRNLLLLALTSPTSDSTAPPAAPGTPPKPG